MCTLIDNGLVIFDWFAVSMRMQVILDSLFARPGSAPKWGEKKGEFRDWTRLTDDRASTCYHEMVRKKCYFVLLNPTNVKVLENLQNVNFKFSPGEHIPGILSFDYYEYFDKGCLKRTQRMILKDLLELTENFRHFERRDSQHENIPINKPLKPSYRTFEVFNLEVYI